MQRIITILLSSLILGCSDDRVTTKFTDLQHAKAEHAFERGWLPRFYHRAQKILLK